MELPEWIPNRSRAMVFKQPRKLIRGKTGEENKKEMWNNWGKAKDRAKERGKEREAKAKVEKEGITCPMYPSMEIALSVGYMDIARSIVQNLEGDSVDTVGNATGKDIPGTSVQITREKAKEGKMG